MKLDYSNTEVMADLLRRLENATTNGAKQMIAESDSCNETYLALNTHSLSHDECVKSGCIANCGLGM